MGLHTRFALTLFAAAGLLGGTAMRAQASELNFLDMLFGARPAPQAQPPALDPSAAGRVAAQPGGGRRLRTRYAALPVRIHAREPEISPRQTPIDMKEGPTAALLRDDTLRPGDIVVLKSGARVFTGEPEKHHAMHDFAPVQSSAYVSKDTKRAVAGLFTPVRASPAQEARRLVARSTKIESPVATPIPAEKTAMRVINVWQAAR